MTEIPSLDEMNYIGLADNLFPLFLKQDGSMSHWRLYKDEGWFAGKILTIHAEELIENDEASQSPLMSE